MPDPEKKKASINIAGPAELGSDLLSPRTLTEAIPAGVKAGGSSLLGGLLNFPELVSNTPVLNRLPMAGPIALTQDPAEFSLPEPLQKFKDFLKSSEAANNYTQKYYDGESLASLFGKLAKSGSVEDLKRFTDYTANKVAEQIPSQIGLYASAMAGVPAPLALSIIGASSAGNKYQDDNQQYPELKPEDRLIRAYSSGELEAGTEGLSYGVKGAAMAGKSALEAIPGVKSILAGEMGQSLKGVFSGLSKAVGATPARKVMSNILFNMFGEGSEEVVNEAANMWMDEHYKVKQYEFKDYLNRAIEAFGISAIASGILSSPGSAIGELSDRREYANAGNRLALPQFEELVATSHMIDVYNKGLDGSTNPDNQPRIVSGELILLQELADDMLKNGEWNDSEGSGALENIGNYLKQALYDERGFARISKGEGWGRRYSSWLSKVKKEGGLDPSSLEDLGYNLKELREFGLGGIIKKGGLKVDSYAEELTGLGLLKPAGNETPSDALIRTLKQKAKITNESANAWERQYEKEYSEWLKKQSESGADEADIRRAEKELEADLEKEDHSQEIEGGAGGGIDFNFGSNAKTPPPVSQSASTSQPVPPLSQRQDNYEGLYQKYINRMQSIENLSERAKAQGLTIRPGEDPKLRARSYLGIGKKVESILEDKTFYVKPDGTFEITGEGLKPILEFYDKNSPEKNVKQRDQDLRDYLISTRYLEDLDRPKKPGSNETIATPAQLTKAANDILRINKKYGKDISFLKGTAKRIYAYQRRVLETLVHSGNMSREKFDSIIATNPHYVPFDRIIEDADPFTAGVPKSSNRFSGARSPVKKIKGSEKEIFDPIESIVKNTYRIIDAADRNSVAASVAKLAAKFPDDISPVKIDMIPINLTESEGGGEEKTIFRPSQFAPKGRVIEYFEDGKRKYIEVSKNLYDAMKGLNEDGVGLLTKIFSIPATLLRKGAALTPEFMFRNPIRDQFTAFMNDPNTPKNVKSILGVLIQGKKTIGAMGDILKKDSTYYDWLRSGGAYSGFVEIDRKNLKKHVENLLKRPDILGKLNIIAHAESLSQFFEQATRIGVFKSATEKGMSPMEAGFLSREATIDFARRGSQTKDVNAAIAFFNAGLQGVDKSFRAMQKDPAGFIAKGIAAITIPSIAFLLLNWDDPEYDEIPRWQKDLFWVFKARGTWWRIPKPFLFGQIFGTVPERLIEKAFKNKPLEGKKLAGSVYKSISPIGDDISGLLATGIKPILENQANWNYFLDRPIVPQSRENLLPAQQYTRGTTETAKKIGSVLNYSPAKIENTVQGWLGGSGKYLLQAGDEVLVAAKRIRGEVVNRKPLELTDIPLIKGFVVNMHSPESVNRFYENKKKVDAAYLSLSKVLGEGKTEEAKKILKSNPQVKAYLLFSKLSDAIREIDSAIESIGKSSLSDQDKRQRTKKAEGFKLAIAKKGNSVIDRIQ